jgi:hypothetical protein
MDMERFIGAHNRGETMTQRISDERLAMLKQYHRHSVNSVDEDTWSALGELERARVLETQLRALAERKRRDLQPIHPEHSYFQLGKNFAEAGCLRELDALLSAHAPAREVEVHLVASKEITKEDAEFICSVVDGLADTLSAHGSQQKKLPMPHNRCDACGTECGGMCGAV